MSPSYAEFVQSLDGETPPPGIDVALRALWFDATGREASALRAASANEGHACRRVRAYLERKAGRIHEARLLYWKAGAPEWTGSPRTEWEDIVKTLLTEGPIADAYQ